MWYVEANFAGEFERWEALTQDQANSVYKKYVSEENCLVRYGKMAKQMNRIDEYSDIYKDVCGVRPSESVVERVEAMSNAEYENFFAELLVELDIEIQREKEAEAASLKTFNTRIVGMMVEYKVPMSEALWWDFEGFENDIRKLFDKNGWASIDSKFEEYLYINGIALPGDVAFYRGVFNGEDSDYELKALK